MKYVHAYILQVAVSPFYFSFLWRKKKYICIYERKQSMDIVSILLISNVWPFMQIGFIDKIPSQSFSDDHFKHQQSSRQVHSSVYSPVQTHPGSINDIDTTNYSTGEFDLGYTWFWRYWNTAFLYLSMECKIIQTLRFWNVQRTIKSLSLLHSEWPKLHGVSEALSAVVFMMKYYTQLT